MKDFPYERARPGQLEVAREIIESIPRERVSVLQAPTGFGKTIAVLYAVSKLLRAGHVSRALYVVRTRNELNPVLREARRIGLRYSYLFSAKRMCPLAQLSEDIDIGTFWLTCSSLRLRGLCPYYARLEKVSINDIEAIARSSEDYISSSRSIADRLGVCPFFSLLRLAEESDLVVATYPYVFKKRIWESTLSFIEPSTTLLIVDEAHSITNFGSLYGESIGIHIVKKSIEEIEKFFRDDPRAREVLPILKKMCELHIDSDLRGLKYVGKEEVGFYEELADHVKSLAIDLKLTIVAKLGNRVEDAMKSDIRLPQLASFLDTLKDSRFQLFASRDRRGVVQLHALPIEPTIIRDTLEKFRSVLLMSGTAPTREFLEGVVGIERIRYIDAEEHGFTNFARENLSVIVFSALTSSYRMRSDSMYKLYADLVSEIYRAAEEGVVLAVYPSYEFMFCVLKRVRIVDDYIVEREDTAISSVVDLAIKRDKLLINAVAGGKLTEGIEIVRDGESLIKVVLILGVPYPQPDDYLSSIEKSIASRGRSSQELYRVIAVTRVLQALGRAIRSEHDYALAILADKRFLAPSILRMLRLRIRRVTRSLDEVISTTKAFYQQLKHLH